MIKATAAGPNGSRNPLDHVISISMSTAEALLLRLEIEDMAQAFPDPALLQGDTPFAQVYMELTRILPLNLMLESTR